MGGNVSRNTFDWTYTEEPHASRRAMILRKHPEIRQLFGFDPSFIYVTIAMVITQLFIAYLLRNADWTLILLQAYCAGGVFNFGLILAIHEAAHNIAFGSHQPWKNCFFGMFANMPVGIPLSVSFQKYHIEHHRYLGADGIDGDIPTELEAKFFTNTWRKLLYLVAQPVFIMFRPLIAYNMPLTNAEVLNFVFQIAFDVFISEYFGTKMLVYLMASTLLSLGCHPISHHFISAHYVLTPDQDTYSYIGPMNYATFNIGYHVEHHDFPYIPSNRLPLVRKLAPEFYDGMFTHTSVLWLMWNFLTDPSMGSYARLKRPPRVEKNKFHGQ